MKIREVRPEDQDQWLRMRNDLWPDEIDDNETEVRRFFEEPDERMHTFVAEDERGGLVGFLELEQRKWAAGCRSSPVPYIEGWYVDSAARRKGIGRALVQAAENWARQAGFSEIASDAELDNATSQAAHLALGYQETERVVCFRRSLIGE